MSKMDEMILAIPRKELFGVNDEYAFQGVNVQQDILVGQLAVEKRRGDLEEDPNFKQLITYAVVIEAKEGKILVYERIGNGDDRLHLKSSIGVGGHANHVPNIVEFERVLGINALREIEEEINGVDTDSITLEVIGYINDDSDEVGKVHVGIAYACVVEDATAISVNETDTLRIAWKTKEELLEDSSLENWSKLLLPYL